MFENRIRDAVKNIPAYIPGKSIEAIQEKYGIDHVIKLASNENPLGPAIDLSKLDGCLTQFYPDLDRSSLFEKLATIHGLEPHHVMVGNGSDELIQLLCLAFLNHGDEVLTADCTFSAYALETQLMGGILKEVPLKKNCFDLSAMATAVSDKTKLIFIANPNNPTGTIVTHTELETFLNQVPSDVLVILDEAYFDFSTHPDFPRSTDLLKKHPNVVILRTFSKLYGLAAFRIGYGLAHPELVAILKRIRQPFSVNTLAVKAAELALDQTDFVQQTLDNNEAGKRFLYRELDALNLSYQETEANFIYVDLPGPAMEITERLLEKGIILRPLKSFGRPNALRVTIGTEVQNKAFINVFKKVIHNYGN